MELKRIEEMFCYIEEQFKSHHTFCGGAKQKIKYNRYLHTRRVFRLVSKIYSSLSFEVQDTVDFDALAIATIFHDVGYSQIRDTDHAKMSEEICLEYFRTKNESTQNLKFVCYLIRNHCNKHLLEDKETPLELVILLEADLLDDTGAQGIVMDVWVESLNEDTTFESILEHMKKYTYAQMQINPMRTTKAKEIWENKKQLTLEFVKQYEEDIAI